MAEMEHKSGQEEQGLSNMASRSDSFSNSARHPPVAPLQSPASKSGERRFDRDGENAYDRYLPHRALSPRGDDAFLTKALDERRNAPTTLEHIARYLAILNSNLQFDIDRLLKVLVYLREATGESGALEAIVSLRLSKEVGTLVQELLSRDVTSFASLADATITLGRYLGQLERTLQVLVPRKRGSFAEMAWSALLERREAQQELDRAVQQLQRTLRAAMSQADTFRTMVNAGVDLERLSMTPHPPDGSTWSRHDAPPVPRDVRPALAPSFDPTIRQLAVRAFQPSNPYLDVPGAHLARHEQLKSNRMNGSGTWLVEDPRFQSWLDDVSSDLFWCHGQPGTGKSMLASKVIDGFKEVEHAHAYFYLGRGKVQTASGAALALLEQLCAITGQVAPPLGPSLSERRSSTDSDTSDMGSLRVRSGSRSRRSFFVATRSPELEVRTIVPPSITRAVGSPEVVTASLSSTPTAATSLRAVNSGSGHSVTSSRVHRGGTTGSQGNPERRSHTSFVRSMSTKSLAGAVPSESADANPRGQSLRVEYRHRSDVGDRGRKSVSDASRAVNELLAGTASLQDPVPLQGLFAGLVASRQLIPGRLYIVLDGWDEDDMVDPAGFRELLGALRAARCKVFLTSRLGPSPAPDGQVVEMDLCDSFTKICRRSDVWEYAALLFRAKLLRLELELPPVFVNSCVDKVAATSNGIFTAAKLCILALMKQPSMAKPSRRSLEQNMRGLSASLPELSSDVLSDLRRGSSPVAQASFPMTIWVSLSEVFPLSTKQEDQILKMLQRYTEGSGRRVELQAVLDRADPFLAVDVGNHKIHLALHDSRGEEGLEYGSESTKTRAAIAETCMDYLESGPFAGGCCETRTDLVALLQEHHFLGVASHWADYCRELMLDTMPSQYQAIRERVMRFLGTRSCRLALQVVLFTSQRDLEAEMMASWHDFFVWVDSMPTLHIASRLGLATVVTVMLADGLHDLRSRDSRGSTALHAAAKLGFAGVADALLAADGTLAEIENATGQSPLYLAWKHNHGDVFVQLFKVYVGSGRDCHALGGVDLGRAIHMYSTVTAAGLDSSGTADPVGVAVLHAVRNGLTRVAKLLMFSGDVDLDVILDGDSSLHSAVADGHDDIASQLVLAGANPLVDVPNSQGEPILHLVIRKNMRATFTQLLKSSHSVINRVDGAGQTALFPALDRPSDREASKLARRLMRHGLDIDIRDDAGRHVLHVAAARGHASIISDLLFRTRLTEEPRDNEGNTPVDCALKHHHGHVAAMLSAAQGQALYGRDDASGSDVD